MIVIMIPILRVIIYKDTFIEIHLFSKVYIKIVCRLKK